MTAEILKTPTAVILVIVLLYNLTMRKHLAHGEQKRIAVLKSAILILSLYGGILAVIRFNLPDSLLIPLAAVVFLLFLFFRKTFLPFNLKCGTCRKTLPIKRILYYDSNICPECESAVNPDSVGDIDWETWEPDEKAVLCFIRDNDKILLIHKKTGLGAGKINGPGGRLEPGETEAEAAVRETEEETGLVPLNPEKRGVLFFQFKDGYKLLGTVFFASEYSGKMIETDEALPFWCNIEEIPFEKMWEDDILWLPEAIKGKHFNGKFIFDKDSMISRDLEIED